MKQIRCFFVTVALLISLSGAAFLPGVGALANTALSGQASAQHTTTAFRTKPNGFCPIPGVLDC